MTDDQEARLAALEQRVARHEDDLELRRLLGRYGFCADMGLHDEWLALWTEDGVYDIVASPATLAYAGKRIVFAGQEGLRRLIEDPAGHMNIEGRSGHLSSIDLRTHVDGDDATAESYDLVMVREEAGMVVWGAGINRWTFRREGGDWRIAERVRRALGGEGLRDVFLDPRWDGFRDPQAQGA
ncbi:MAG: nuclear transport factor 2 family protein [Solirubrobacteraceae bacterium]